MAEFDKYVNYPSFPGMWDWKPSQYDRQLTEDYITEGTNLPAASIAVRLDILSDAFPVGAWLGPIVPLPSAIALGFGYATTISLTGKYWNWLTYGYFLHTVAGSESGYSVPRPAVFHHQMGNAYKEVAHYGYGIVLLALVTSDGRVFVTNVVSCVPFMEHRHQCRFVPFLINSGSISSASMSIANMELTVNPFAGSSISVQEIDFLSGDSGPLDMTLYWKEKDGDGFVYKNDTFAVKRMLPSSSLILDVGKYSDSIEKGTFPDMTGAFYILSRPIEIEDPKTIYTETQFGRDYLINSRSGYTTREQEIEYFTDSWKSVFYDAELISDYLLQHAEKSDETAATSSDPNAVATAQSDAVRYRAESTAVLQGDAVFDGMHVALNGEKRSVDGVEVVASDVVLREYKALGALSLVVGFDVAPTTLSKHNFGPETQVGNYFTFTTEADQSLSAYKVLLHARTGIFTLSVVSESSVSTLFDSLGGRGTFRISSQKLWKTNDICTNNPGLSTPSTTSLDRGLFDMTVISGSVVASGEGGGRQVVLECKLSDRNYYTEDYLRTRFVDDIEGNAEGVIKAWKKFHGWMLNRQGNEFSASFEIGRVEMPGNNTLQITLPQVEAPEGDEVDISIYSGNWWISFGPPIPVNQPFNYMATPFIGLDAYLTEAGTNASILFNGVYVGSPLTMEVKRDSVIRLIEDFPAIFPNISGVDFSLIKTATSKAYRYIAHSTDDADEAEYILYERDDDVSKALMVRTGRMGFLHNVNEALVHHTSEYVDVKATVSGVDGSSVQTLSVDPALVDGMDIVSIQTLKSDPENYPEPDKAGKYNYTLWRMYQSDRLLGIQSTTGMENSIFTRASGRGTVTGVADIPLYANSEYFAAANKVGYPLAGNTQTGDPLAGTGARFRFIPVLNGNSKHSKISSAEFRAVPSTKVVRNAQARRVFAVNGKNLILVEQPQWSYLGSVSSEISDVTIVPGTESSIEEDNIPPDPSMVFTLDNGVFMLNTTDSFRTYTSGGFFRGTDDDGGAVKRSTMWKYPFLVVPNISQCAFYKPGDIDVVGYTTINDNSGGEATAIVHLQLNMTSAFRKPVFSFNSNGRTAFLWSDIAVARTAVVSSAIPDPEYSPGSATGSTAIIGDLAVYPLAVASNRKYKFIIFRIGTTLQWAMSSDVGGRWSFYDDIVLTSRNSIASSPSIEIRGDWLYMCYIANKTELRIKKISIPSLVKFHVRYIGNVVSSTDTGNESIDSKKQGLQAELDNMFDTKITDTFDQQVSFSIGGNGIMRVVFFDQKGLVNSASSSDEGNSWNLSPVNF